MNYAHYSASLAEMKKEATNLLTFPGSELTTHFLEREIKNITSMEDMLSRWQKTEEEDNSPLLQAFLRRAEGHIVEFCTVTKKLNEEISLERIS